MLANRWVRIGCTLFAVMLLASSGTIAIVEEANAAQAAANGLGVWLALLLVLSLIVVGGLLGGHLGGGDGVQADAEHPEHLRPRRPALAEGIRKMAPSLAGIAGAIVGVTFASGPIDYNYESIFQIATGNVTQVEPVFEKFVMGVVKLLGVSIIGGYLGVGLIRRTATKLFEELEGKVKEVDQRVGEVQHQVVEAQGSIRVEQLIRVGRNLLAKGVVKLAWEVLEEMPKGPIRESEMADLRLLRGYALKRLDRLGEAIAEVDAALEIRPHRYEAWYNKACYTALQLGPKGVQEVLQMIEQALDQADRQGASEAIEDSLKNDTVEGGDLYEFREEDIIASRTPKRSNGMTSTAEA